MALSAASNWLRGATSAWYRKQGDFALQRKNLPAATAAYLRALDLRPNDTSLLMGLADLKAAQQDIVGQIEFLARCGLHDQTAGEQLHRLLAGVIASGTIAQIETVLGTAIKCRPDDIGLWRHFGWSATRQQRWPEAAERWHEVWRRDPADISAARLSLQALRRGNRFAEALEMLTAIEAAFPDVDHQVERDRTEFCASSVEVLRRLESLGRGCEVGFLQREVGYEPLGLLRWNSITPEGLVTALKTRFAGIGDPDRSALRVLDDEYWLDHPTYDMFSHTFISATEDAERVLASQRRRLQFLAQKLMEDLADAEKIFIFKWADPNGLPPITAEHVSAIHSALQSYGPNRLLIVATEYEGMPAGSFVQDSDTLARATIAYATAFDGVTDSDFRSWTTILACVAAIWL